jgi:hypothetical protein
MTLVEGDDGRLYGTAPVLLCRIVNGESEHLIGYASPFGGIMVTDYGNVPYTEEPKTFWEREGFKVTESPLLLEARMRFWGQRDKKKYECNDCEFDTDSDQEAWDHARDKKHCVGYTPDAVGTCNGYCTRADH